MKNWQRSSPAKRTNQNVLLGRSVENRALSQRRKAELGQVISHQIVSCRLSSPNELKAGSLGNPYRSRLTECAGERACVYYLVRAKTSYAVVLSDGKYRLYTLPGSERLAEINAKVDALIAAEPKVLETDKRQDHQ